eukprot:gene26038-31440_t
MSKIDYEPFRRAVRRVLDQPVAPLVTNSTPLHCHFPLNSVMFTYSSHYTVELMGLQNRGLAASGMGTCLAARFIRLCLDVACRQYCSEHHIEHCPLIDLHMLPPSDFNKGEYRFFTFLKHLLLREALQIAEEAFFFDIDCLVMKNPFVLPQYGRDDHGDPIDERYDLMFQRDRGRGPSCAGSVNSGQMYLRNSTRVQKYLQLMAGFQDVILEGKNGLDQDFVSNASVTAELKMCSLTPDFYTAHCYLIFGNIHYINAQRPVDELISYHTSCVEGLATKRSHLLRVLTAVENKQSGSMSAFIRR